MMRSPLYPTNKSSIVRCSVLLATAMMTAAIGLGYRLPSAQAMCFDNGSCCDCNAPCCDHPCAVCEWVNDGDYCILGSPDSDSDGWPDQCDNCPEFANAHPLNTCANEGWRHDQHCHYDFQCDSSPGAQDGHCFTAQQDDVDGDGVGDFCDNCPMVANNDQDDDDHDGVGDACSPAKSRIQFILELGGNNHSGSGSPVPPFTPGDRADDQSFQIGSKITWDARVSVSGKHDDPGKPGHGAVPNGLAGVCFNLELHQGTAGGPLAGFPAGSASSSGWYSSAETGKNAAFAKSFNIGGHGQSGGRVFDPLSAGGPYLAFTMYPTASGEPPEALTPPGVLAGQTAAVDAYTAGTTAPGVGVSGPTGLTGGGCPGLGILPLFEGQMNTTGLDPGTYVLVLVPRGGLILRGDFNCLTESPARFAVPANEVIGDEISFSLTAP